MKAGGRKGTEGTKGAEMRDAEGTKGAEEAGDSESRDTRDRLIRAGRKLFATEGFRGTSIRALTEEAHANLGAVTYHFESKEKLYHAVLEDVFGPIREQARMLRSLPFSPLQRLEFFIQGMFQQLRDNPDVPRFMVQEIVLGEEPAPPVLDQIGVIVPILIGIIQEGQEVGTIRNGDPVLMALSTISQPIYLSIMPPVLARDDLRRAGVPQPRMSPEDHAVEFVVRGLETREEEETE